MGEYEFSSHPGESKVEESGRPSGRTNLLARNSSPGTSVSSARTHALASRPHVTSVPPDCYVERSNQFHLPATFTWIVCAAPLGVSRAFGAPGISRMRLDARARIYPAQTLRYWIRWWISLLRISAVEFVLLSPVYRIPRVFDTRASLPRRCAT